MKPMSLDDFLRLYPEHDNRGPWTSRHTHGGNRFLMFAGTPAEFCAACAVRMPPDPPRPINDGAMDPRD